MAYDAISDGSLNPYVTDADAKRFITEQLIVARKCAERLK
jgi:hypothetical protein